MVIEKPPPKTEESKAAIKEQNSMLYRLHNEVANLNGRMAKSHQEFYDYVNLRLNEYVRLNQFHVMQQSLLEYALQTTVVDLKQQIGSMQENLDLDYIRREEFTKSHSDLTANLNMQLNQRITSEDFLKQTTALEKSLNDKIATVKNSCFDLTKRVQSIESDMLSTRSQQA